MRIRTVIMLFLLAVPWAGSAAENLLVNGILDAEQTDFPNFWSHSGNVEYLRSGAPDGKGAVKLTGGSKAAMIRQEDVLMLVPGEKYRLSGYFRTENIRQTTAQSKNSPVRFCLYNKGWQKEIGYYRFKPDSNWFYAESIITAMPSSNGRYSLTVYLSSNTTGNVYAAKLQLEALTPKGKANSKSKLADMETRALVPIGPLLKHIPVTNPVLTCEWIGRLPVPETDCEVVYQLNNGSAKTTALVRRRVRLDLAGTKAGTYTLQVQVKKRHGNTEIFKANWPIAVIMPNKLQPANARRLNNLVTELADIAAKPGQTYKFINPRTGWVHFSGSKAAIFRIPEIKRTITGEGICNLAAGKYTLVLTSNKTETISIRAITEIIYYPLCSGSRVPGSGRFNWNFTKKYLTGVVTTFNGAPYPDRMEPEEYEEMHALELELMSDESRVGKVDSPVKMAEIISHNRGLTASAGFSGTTVDEIPLASFTMMNCFCNALPLVKNPYNRKIYAWIYGKPSLKSLTTRLLSEVFNCADGRGKVLYEAYATAQTNEKTAAGYLRGIIVETVCKLNECYPGAVRRTGIILGNFTQLPVLSLAHYPDFDYKYYLDMQMNLIANAPELADIGAIGYWGGSYSDEEMVRWSARLLRHYAIDGNTTMLSPHYGFTFSSRFLKNCDFTEGVKFWQCSGKVTIGVTKDFGKKIEKRWNAPRGVGDTYAILPKNSSIMQNGGELTIGRLYALKYLFTDANAPMTANSLPDNLKLDVSVEGGELVKPLCFQSNADGKYAKVNSGRLVFKALRPNITVHFVNKDTTPIALNYITLHPYYAEE